MQLRVTNRRSHRRRRARVALTGAALAGAAFGFGCTPLPGVTPAPTTSSTIAPTPKTAPVPAPAPQPTPTRVDGARLVYAPPAGESAQNPAISPDGSSLLMTRFHRGYNVGPSGIFVVSLASRQPGRAVIDDAGHDSVNLPGASWNPSTNRIVFASDRGGHPGIWTVNPDGTSEREVVAAEGAILDVLEPSFSPDGRFITYEARAKGSARGTIWVVHVDGSEAKQITGADQSTDDRQPNWSPTGDRILVQRRAVGTDAWDLAVMASDGTNLQRITTVGAATDASWSPDGRHIVFSATRPATDAPSIFIAPAGGGPATQVTNDPSHGDGAPSWSPDGRSIVFESFAGPTESAASIWSIEAPARP